MTPACRVKCVLYLYVDMADMGVPATGGRVDSQKMLSAPYRKASAVSPSLVRLKMYALMCFWVSRSARYACPVYLPCRVKQA